MNEVPSLPVSEKTVSDLQELHGILTDVKAEDGNCGDDDIRQVIDAWYASATDGLVPEIVDKDSDEVDARGYVTYQLSQTVSGRTFRISLQISEDFGSALQTRIRRCTELMMSAVLTGQTACFIRTAQENGLTWRRKRSYHFPHPLPYLNPPPTTNNQRYAEEAGVIAAALRYALGKASPGIILKVNRFNKGPNGSSWTRGSATVNYYDSVGRLRISLNGRALDEANFDDRAWAGVIVHEILHNLGWEHPDGVYKVAMAIRNYQRCVERGRPSREADEDQSLD